MLIPGSDDERDYELPREEAEAEWEALVEVAATEIEHRYRMESEPVREMGTGYPALRKVEEWLAACFTRMAVGWWTHLAIRSIVTI